MVFLIMCNSINIFAVVVLIYDVVRKISSIREHMDVWRDLKTNFFTSKRNTPNNFPHM